MKFTLSCLLLALTVAACGMAPETVPETDPARASEPVPATMIEIPNARIHETYLLVGGQPTVEHLREASEAGYKSIVNLRSGKEKAEVDQETVVEGLGMRYVHIPIAGGADMTVENAKLLADAVADPALLPSMVHCASGNRVGALFAIKATMLDGVSAEEAIKLGVDAGMTRLEPVVRKLLEEQAP